MTHTEYSVGFMIEPPTDPTARLEIIAFERRAKELREALDREHDDLVRQAFEGGRAAMLGPDGRRVSR